jgi:hypothetical protein
MIKPLRKRHVQIWCTLAVLIPLGIISAWLVVPAPVKDKLLNPVPSEAFHLLIKSISKDTYTVSLRRMEDSSALQLEWINHSVLTAPSAIIYEIYPQKGITGVEGAALIGRIDARGTYHFPLEKDSSNIHASFILYDIIHHREIDRINF